MKKNRDEVRTEIPPLFTCQGNIPWKKSRPFTFVGVSKKGALFLEHGATAQALIDGSKQKGDFEHFAVIKDEEVIEGDIAHLVLPFRVIVPGHTVDPVKTAVKGFWRERYVFFLLDKDEKPKVLGIATPPDDDLSDQRIKIMKASSKSYVQTDIDGAILALCIKAEHQELFRKLF
jgi:hypothetical protein